MGPRTLGPPMLGQKHLYCGFRLTTPESTPVPRTSQGLCHFHVFGKFVKYIEPPLGQVLQSGALGGPLRMPHPQGHQSGSRRALAGGPGEAGARLVPSDPVHG